MPDAGADHRDVERTFRAAGPTPSFSGRGDRADAEWMNLETGGRVVLVAGLAGLMLAGCDDR
jgi:hypothetical protein